MSDRRCWLCPSPATWLQQLDQDQWFTPLCDRHVAQADHHNPRYHYWRAGSEPPPTPEPEEETLLILPDA